MAPGTSTTNVAKNIAIVGAGGNVGSHIVEALLECQQFNITAISRAESKANFPDDIAVARINYNDQDTVIQALRGHDVLIITLSVFADPKTEANLIRAAADAGVPWVLPNEFGMYNTEEAQLDTIGPSKTKHRELIESIGVSSWIGVVTGFWYEHSLGGPGLFGFDIGKREAVIFDDGTQKQNTSTWPQVGRGIAALLASPGLSIYRNRMVYISSFALSQHDMFASLKRVTKTTDADWSIKTKSSREHFNDGKERMKKGDRTGFAAALYGRYFFPGEDAGLFEKSHGLENDKIGLPVEDLDEATKRAVELSESNYWASYGLKREGFKSH